MTGEKTSAIIGCGRIAFLLEEDPLRNKPCSHIGGAAKSGIKIDFACDVNIKRLRYFAEKNNIAEENCFSDFKQLLDKKQPSLVIIATPTDSHAEIGISAAMNGAEIIVVEKPVASNLKDAQKLIKTCEENNTKLIVNHERRYDPGYKKVREIIDSGKIGKIKTVHASVLTGGYRGESEVTGGGGPLLHDGTHIVDLLRFYFGEIKHVRGEFQRDERDSGFEDRAVAWLKTEGGIDIFLEAGGSRKYFVFELIISGTHGKLVIGNGYKKLFLTKTSQHYTGFRDLEEKKFPSYSSKNCFHNLYTEVKSHLDNKPSDITSSGYDGMKALETIHAIYLSAYKNARETAIPVKPSSVRLERIFNLRENK